MSVQKHSSVEVYRDATELGQNAAEQITKIIQVAINDRGVCFVALSGGETPRQTYRHLGMEPLKDRVAWSYVHLFFSDERCVPPDDPQSNYGMVYRSLLTWVDIPRQNIHRIQGEVDPSIAAREYGNELKEAFGGTPGRFDLMLLGIGEDGHVASMFPGADVVHEKSALVRPVIFPNQNARRVTLTFPTINNAREILFLVSGKRKSSVVQRVLSISRPTMDLPATMVRPIGGNLRWLLDREAASQLDPTIEITLC